MKTKNIFCANEQIETPHELVVDDNGEIVATCPCGRFIKFPKGLNATEVENMIAVHQEANALSEEQVAIEEARKASEEVIEVLADPQDLTPE